MSTETIDADFIVIRTDDGDKPKIWVLVPADVIGKTLKRGSIVNFSNFEISKLRYTSQGCNPGSYVAKIRRGIYEEVPKGISKTYNFLRNVAIPTFIADFELAKS